MTKTKRLGCTGVVCGTEVLKRSKIPHDNEFTFQGDAENQDSIHVEDHRSAFADGHRGDLRCNLAQQTGRWVGGNCCCNLVNYVLD